MQISRCLLPFSLERNALKAGLREVISLANVRNNIFYTGIETMQNLYTKHIVSILGLKVS